MPVVGLIRPVVGLVLQLYGSFGRRGHRQADSDQALIDQKAKGGALGCWRRDVVARAGSSVDNAKQRVIYAVSLETRLGGLRADGPPRPRLMAGEAGPAVGAEVLEEGILAGGGGSTGLVSRHRPG